MDNLEKALKTKDLALETLYGARINCDRANKTLKRAEVNIKAINILIESLERIKK